MNRIATACVFILTVSAQAASGQSSSGNTVPVTVENFIRAESDLYLSAVALKENGFGKFEHHRELSPIDAQTIVRMNRDTLYSAAVFDLDAGPVTITLPDAGKRFMSLQLISQDEYSPPAAYGAGKHTITKEQVGTRYVLVGVRTLVDPNDAADVKEVHALQDAIKVDQPGGPGKFETPKWDPVSQKKVRDALIVLGTTLTDTSHSFGTKDQVEPIQRLISAATTWGGNPRKDAIYLNFTPPKNDGNTIYRLNVRDVPVDGFWSISLYNADGYFQKNHLRRLLAEQYHVEEKCGWFGHRSVRRLRRQDSELLADHAGLELHGAPLSPTRRNPERLVEIPATTTCHMR